MSLRVVAKQTFREQEVRNVFYVGGQDSESHDNAQDIADYFRATWATNLANALSDSWTLYEFDIQVVSETSQPVLQYQPTSGTLVGASTGTEAVANQVSLLVSFRSPTTRPNRSRKYLAGIVHTAIEDGIFNAGTIALAEAWADDLLDIGSGTSLDLDLVVCRFAGDPPTLVAQNTMTNKVVATIPTVQRRRRIGQGQ